MYQLNGPPSGRDDVDVLVAEEALKIGEPEPALAARREVSARVEVVAAVDAGQQIEGGRTRLRGLEDVVDDRPCSSTARRPRPCPSGR